MEFRYLGDSEFDKWDSFVDENEGYVFSKSFWYKELAKNLNKKHEIIVLEKNKNIAAGISVLIDDNSIITGKLTPFNSIVLKNKISKNKKKIIQNNITLLDAFAEYFEKNHHSIRLILYPMLSDIRSFIWKNWTVKPIYDFYLDLEKFKIEDLSHNFRRNIKMAKSKNIFTKIGVKEYDEKYYDLFQKSFGRKNKDLPLNKKEFEKFCNFLIKKGVLEFNTAYSGNNMIAFRGNIIDSNNIHDWIAGSDPSYFDTKASPFLLRELIEKYKQAGYKNFIFGGANTPGVWEFKAQFQGNLIHYFMATKQKIVKRSFLERIKRKLFK
ncbi:GNAT family N-acetyltransferase [bacterium]|nr:GNAT family N-acetyltransferase [bacterium]